MSKARSPSPPLKSSLMLLNELSAYTQMIYNWVNQVCCKFTSHFKFWGPFSQDIWGPFSHDPQRWMALQIELVSFSNPQQHNRRWRNLFRVFVWRRYAVSMLIFWVNSIFQICLLDYLPTYFQHLNFFWCETLSLNMICKTSIRNISTAGPKNTSVWDFFSWIILYIRISIGNCILFLSKHFN